METPETEEQLTLEQVATKIKGLISTSALAKIEIGELLNQYTAKIKHGDKVEFYKSIKMSTRTAQYYMKIASNEEIQKLKKEEKLDGLNMSEILKLVGMRVNVRGVNNEDAPQAQAEYTPKGYGSFDFSKCRSTRIFREEYELLAFTVTELQAELETLGPKTA